MKKLTALNRLLCLMLAACMAAPPPLLAQLFLTQPQVSDESVRITLSGASPGSAYLIQSSTDLGSNVNNWRDVATGGIGQITFDLPLTDQSAHFYRASELPGLRESNAFIFTSQKAVTPGSLVRSGAIIAGGFVGQRTAVVPTGVTAYLNGVAQTASAITVKAGDLLWMQTTAPQAPGIPRIYTLHIGDASASWQFTTAALASVRVPSGIESGYSPVESGVSESGAAQISLPIVVSPGTAGMQPKLALNYSSQAGNGPIGLGFNLGGLSTINRVGRTLAQDGVKGGVSFDANDRFALDGQRLIVVSGNDGAAGAEYRLEFDPTSRIRSHGVEGNGPQYWTVETKAGLTLSFGAQPFARVKPEGGDSALVWAVDKITDTLGNGIEFTYDDIARQRGEVLLTRIAYTSNPAQGLTANQEVVFEYEDRPDTEKVYVGGFAVNTLKRLHAIESRAKDAAGTMQQVRRYEMTYQQDALTTASELNSVQETRADGSTSPATQFVWPDSNASESYFKEGSPTGISSTGNTVGDFLTGDFDGDGRTDVLVWGAPGQPNRFSLFRSNGDGFDPGVPTALIGNSDTRSHQTAVLDFNGDGKTDVIMWADDPAQYRLFHSTGLNFQKAPPGFPADIARFPHWFADFTGDGRSDMLIWNYSGNPDRYTLFVADATSVISSVATILTQPTDGKSYTGDLNGDGRADMVAIDRQPPQYYFHFANASGTFEQANVTTVNPMLDTDVANIFGDFNGDGLLDLIVWGAPTNPNEFTLYVCNGNGFGPPVPVKGGGGGDVESNRYQHAVDFNGDGKTDLITWNYPSGSSRFRISTSLGNDFTEAAETAIPSNSPLNLVGDFNGDGKTDMLVWGSPASGQFNRWLSQGPPPRLIQKVISGHGGYTKFGYKLLTDPGVHTKGTGLTYPCYDLQASMAVVSSVSSRNGLDGDPFTGAGVGAPGENTVNYRYEGAWACLDGRGFQGFKAMETTDLASGIVSRTEYVVDPLLSGRPSHTEQRLTTAPAGGSALISATDMTWNLITNTLPSGLKSYFIHESSSTTREFETARPAGESLVKTTTRNGISYDTFANLFASETTTTGAGQAFSERVANTYANHTNGSWILGRLLSSSVTKTAPGSPDLTRRSTFAYHPVTGLLTSEIVEPDAGTLRLEKTYIHDGFGNIIDSILKAPGEPLRRTTTTYTDDGRFVATTMNALGHTESKTYDPLLGNVLTQTGPNGLTTRWEYDSIGRPVRELRPDGTETRTTYRRVTSETAGAPARAVHYVVVQSSGGSPRTVWYDLLDREIRTDAIAFDGRTVSTHRVFDQRGEIMAASEPYFAGDTPLYSVFVHDAVGRLVRETAPGNRVTTITHDGLVTQVINPLSQTNTRIVNVMGWTVRTTDNAGKHLDKAHDAYGNLRFVTDPAGNITEMRYDVRGNKVWMSEPNSGLSTYAYNAFGELREQTDAKGQTISLVHDRLGRVTRRTEPHPGGPAVTTFAYDTAAGGIGRLARETGPGFSRTFYYDSLGRPATTVEIHGSAVFAVSRSYDQYSRPDTLTYPTGFAVRQIYNAYGHLAEVCPADITSGQAPVDFYWRALDVNARGQIALEALGNGILTNRQYDPETGLITAIRGDFDVIGDVQDEAYAFDDIGNLTQRHDRRHPVVFQEHFGYDPLNRLVRVDTTGRRSAFAIYDELGNLTDRTDVGLFSYGQNGAGPHALTAVSDSSGGSHDKACTYDANGNRITDGATAIEYDAANRAVRIARAGDELRFEYGPGRELYRQTLNHTSAGQTRQTVRDYVGGLYEREVTNDGVTRHIHYVAGGSGVAAIYTEERGAGGSSQRLRYLHRDHLGSVAVITDHGGTVVERLSFDAWGRRRTVNWTGTAWTVTYPAAPAAGASAETHRGFTGHEMLDAVGLVHMGGRIYDPITSRFLSPDPFVQSPDNLQNLNRYSYVLNNPLNYTDPSGFFFKSIAKFFKKHWRTAVGIAAGALTGFAAVAVFAPAAGLSTALVATAGGGFGSAFSGTLLAGGSVGDALRAGIRGGIQAVPTAGALYGVDLVLPDFISRNVVGKVKVQDWFKAERVAHEFLRIGVRGAVRGAFSEAYGGSFSTGLKWSVIPDISKFGLEAVSAYDLQKTWMNPETRSALKYDPHTELGLRTHRVFFGKQQDQSTYDRNGVSMTTAEVSNTGSSMWDSAAGDFVKEAGVFSEGSTLMRFLERTLLLGSGHGVSHDSFVTSFGIPKIPALGTSFFAFGDMRVINEFSNVPYFVPNYLGHAANLANPSSARVRR